MQDDKSTNFDYNNITIKRKDGNNSDIVKVENGSKAKFYLEKACFTRYIDEEERISFPDNVGKCDHINSCGYHYTPKEYFYDNP